MDRIDSHQHFWRPARGDYRWLRADDTALAALVRDQLPEHLEPLLRRNGVQRTVLVQAADSLAETDFLLRLAADHGFVGAVVGWVDLRRREAVAVLEGRARQRMFKGVRPMLQDLPEPDWIDRAPDRDAVRTLVRLGLRFDALVRPAHLQPLQRFARRWPELPVVVDHAAKPPLAAGWGSEAMTDWRRSMAEIAALPQVCCKWSGLLTELPPAARVSVAAAVDALRPLFDALLRWFGPQRLMWGSDWPVLTLAGDYAGWVEVSERLLGELTPAEAASVWHGSAARWYAID